MAFDGKIAKEMNQELLKNKAIYMDYANEMAKKAAEANHPKADLFQQVADFIKKNNSPEFWHGKTPRMVSGQQLLNQVAKEIMASR